MNLLSNSTIFQATGALNNLFDTESRLITINKQPIEIINTGVSTSNPNGLYGYGTASYAPQEITYQYISGVFPAVVIYNYKRRAFGPTISQDTKSQLVEGENYVKVRGDAEAFINEGGKVISLNVDNKVWNLGTIRNVQYFYGLYFYYHNLVETN